LSERAERPRSAGADDAEVVAHPPPPPEGELRALLDAHAPLRPAPLSPEIRIFHAHSLVEVWEAAERAAGEVLPSPFWAYPWPAGAALARVILDRPERVAGRRVLDFGCGGGIASLAAAFAGAAQVCANDVDPWALAVTSLAAAAQGLSVTPLLEDLTARETLPACDVVLCADLGYERSVAPAQRALLQRALAAGATVLAADAGRAYFDPAGFSLLAEYDLDVPDDLEGVNRRTARVYLFDG
jgi:predicted nicotinamide N-methyase